MKKISEHAQNIRQDNSTFFILEKYNNDIRESISKTAAIIEAEAAKLKLSVEEYADVLAKLYKKS